MDVMEWYGKHYKLLFALPVVLLMISIGIIGVNIAETGTFVQKGVTLSGGVSATVTIDGVIDADTLEEDFATAFPQADAEVRALNTFGTEQTYVIDAADLPGETREAAESLENHLRQTYTVTALSTETTGPSLGEAFFTQTIIGIFLAFLWMGWVVYLYFGDRMSMKVGMGLLALVLTVLSVRGILGGTTGMAILGFFVLASMIAYLFISVPSGAVILAAASTILFVLAVIDLIDLRLQTAGVAAFLMLIGYSVDTDILLSTRVLKQPRLPLLERMKDAAKTGLTMQVTTTVAVIAALLLSNSEVIRQIMLIILIGMVGDVIFTWAQNAGILYWYVKKHGTPEGLGRKRK